MIISGLKLGIANKKIAPLLRKRSLAVTDDPVRSVGVLLDEATIASAENFVKLKKSLGLEEKDFVIITSQKLRPENPEDGIIYCTANDLNWKGEFNCEPVNEFVQREFDLLICFHHVQTPLIRFLISASNAGLKIGRGKAGDKARSDFDISIFCGVEEADLFVEEVKKYLGILNKVRK